MKVIRSGHKYELESFEGTYPQIIQFIEKQHPSMETIHDGTTNEEVLAVLIDRLRSMGEKLPCRENSIAITKCEEALMWLNKRTAERKARGVEGTSKA
jgi:hypothetical protein